MVNKRSKFILALISIGLGISAFYGTQNVTSKHFEPILAACSTLSKDGFIKEGYHDYEGKLGGTFVCLITQFVHDLVKIQPVGFITWTSTILPAVPATILMACEAGRYGAKGVVKYPIFVGLIAQIFGISVIVPALWVPACIYGGSTSGVIVGAIKPIRVFISALLTIPIIVLTILAFSLDPASYEWTLVAGILAGPVVVLLGILNWPFPAPSESKPDDVAKGCFALANVYMLGSVVTFFGWIVVVFAAITGYGTNYNALWKDLWVEAHPSVAFMTIDAGVLFLGLVVYLLSISVADGILALLLCPMLGPGAACSITLARIELFRGEAATKLLTEKSKRE